MSKQVRQMIGLVCSVVLYYIVHEGAHLVMALHYGVFKTVRFLGLVGIQVDVYGERMTDLQMGILCLAGAVATFLVGWLLVLLRGQICKAKSPVFRAVMWYTSIVMLLLDPLYLSILCSFFGGGDMNGIRLLFPEMAARVVFAAIGVGHGWVLWKMLLPNYKQSFDNMGGSQ